MNASPFPHKVDYRIDGNTVRGKALRRLTLIDASGEDTVGLDFTDFIPNAAKALENAMIDQVAQLGLVFRHERRNLSPAHDLRLSFFFSTETDAAKFKVAFL